MKNSSQNMAYPYFTTVVVQEISQVEIADPDELLERLNEIADNSGISLHEVASELFEETSAILHELINEDLSVVEDPSDTPKQSVALTGGCKHWDLYWDLSRDHRCEKQWEQEREWETSQHEDQEGARMQSHCEADEEDLESTRQTLDSSGEDFGHESDPPSGEYGAPYSEGEYSEGEYSDGQYYEEDDSVIENAGSATASEEMATEDSSPSQQTSEVNRELSREHLYTLEAFRRMVEAEGPMADFPHLSRAVALTHPVHSGYEAATATTDVEESDTNISGEIPPVGSLSPRSIPSRSAETERRCIFALEEVERATRALRQIVEFTAASNSGFTYTDSVRHRTEHFLDMVDTLLDALVEE